MEIARSDAVPASAVFYRADRYVHIRRRRIRIGAVVDQQFRQRYVVPPGRSSPKMQRRVSVLCDSLVTFAPCSISNHHAAACSIRPRRLRQRSPQPSFGIDVRAGVDG